MRSCSLIAVALLGSLSACTFVKMAPGADQVRVVAQGASPAACEKRGEIEVSVKDRLGPYEREPLRVSDELETLARNEAPEPERRHHAAQGGARRWRAALPGLSLRRRPGGARAPKDRAETVPLGD